MKRALVILLAVLAAGCETMDYPYDPYGYPPDPYGYPPPYPPSGPYPAPGIEPPPGAYDPGYGFPGAPDGGCAVSGSSDWRAWINRMPGQGAQPYLFVSGKVTTPTGGYQVVMERDLQLAESYPAQAFATLRAIPPAEAAVQVVVTHNVSGQWPVGQPIGRVVVRCGDRTLAEISPVQSAR